MRDKAKWPKHCSPPGTRLTLLIGVAGSGKTSTLSAVRAGFEAAGYSVIGAATSGQAAKALEEGAGVSSRTVASLTWRLEHRREALSPRHVLVLDESGMTPDAEMAKLLGAVVASGARAIIVGDYRQLDAVGPGGALEALARRHPGRVFALTENVRQRDPAERHALDQLRSGRGAHGGGLVRIERPGPPCSHPGPGHVGHGPGVGVRRRRRQRRPPGGLPP